MSNLTAKERVYLRLYDEILDGVFSPDDILTEGRLIERYGLSKSPVREALVQLTAENVLASIPRLGYKIVPITEQDVQNATQVRLDLELAAFRRLEAQKVPAILARIHSLNIDWQTSASAPGLFSLRDRWRHNALFHTTLTASGGNELAAQIVGQMIRLEFRAYAQMLRIPENRMRFFASSPTKQHFAIEQALGSADFEGAAAALEKDIRSLQNSLPEYIRTASSPL